MKLQTSASNLNRFLESVALEGKTNVFETVRLEIDNGRVLATAKSSDNTSYVRATASWGGEGSGVVGVNVGEFLKFASKFKDDELTLTFTPEGTVQIQGKRKNAVIHAEASAPELKAPFSMDNGIPTFRGNKAEICAIFDASILKDANDGDELASKKSLPEFPLTIREGEIKFSFGDASNPKANLVEVSGAAKTQGECSIVLGSQLKPMAKVLSGEVALWYVPEGQFVVVICGDVTYCSGIKAEN